MPTHTLHIQHALPIMNIGRVYLLSLKIITVIGRIQAQSIRTRIQDQMKHLKDRYKVALKESELKGVRRALAYVIQRDGGARAQVLVLK